MAADEVLALLDPGHPLVQMLLAPVLGLTAFLVIAAALGLDVKRAPGSLGLEFGFTDQGSESDAD